MIKEHFLNPSPKPKIIEQFDKIRLSIEQIQVQLWSIMGQSSLVNVLMTLLIDNANQ